jgi:hypothetical protein
MRETGFRVTKLVRKSFRNISEFKTDLGYLEIYNECLSRTVSNDGRKTLAKSLEDVMLVMSSALLANPSQS